MKAECVEVCPVDALSLGETVIEIDQFVCLGCGLCMPSCPDDPLRLELREDPPKIYKDNDALYRNIYAESAIGLIKKKLGLNSK